MPRDKFHSSPLLHFFSPARPSTSLALLSALVFAFCLFSFNARASDPPYLPLRPGAKVSPVEIVQVDFGFRGTMPSNRFAPVAIWVTSREHAFAGFASISYQQDPTQDARYGAAFSTTPGKVIPIELVAALPENCQSLSITLTDGETTIKRDFTQHDPDPALAMPLVESREVTILVVGEPGPTFAASAFEGKPDIKPALDSQGKPRVYSLWDETSAAHLAPDRLPMSWIAYQGCDAVIAQADDLSRADSRSITALLTWVDGGGRLLLVADQAGSNWTKLLDNDLPIICAPTARHKPSQFLQTLATTESSEPTSVDAAPSAAEPKASPPSHEFGGRLISLSPAGEQRMWTIHWPVADRLSVGPPREGLLAIGPQGAGVVGVLGFDPSLLTANLDAGATQRLYRFAVTNLLPRRTVSLNRTSQTGFPFMVRSRAGWSTYGAGDVPANQAITQATSRVSDIPPVGNGTFIIIASAMALLAAMLGLYDGLFGRKRRAAANTWYFALLWIALTSCAAYFSPLLVRSGQTHAGRFCLIDSICDDQGRVTEGWQSSITGIFGGKPASPRFVPIGAGAWAQGFSSLGAYDTAAHPFSALEVPIVTDPSGMRAGTPPILSQGQWTFRLLMEHTARTALAIPLEVAVRRDAGSDLSVGIKGVPVGAEVTSALIQIGERVFSLESQIGVHSAVDAPPTTLLHPVETQLHIKTHKPTSAEAYAYETYTVADENLGEAFPAALDRSDLFLNALAHGDRFGVLHLTIRSVPLPILTNISPLVEHTEFQYRILVPLPPTSP